MEKVAVKKRAAVMPVILIIIAALTLPLMSGCFLSGCDVGLTSMSFKEETLSLDIGDEYTVTSTLLNFEPVYATNKDFTLSSQDDSVVSVNGRTITAVAPGITTVTATASENKYKSPITAELTVSVGYAAPSVLSIAVAGKKVQYLGKTEEVAFTVSADVEYDPDSIIEWFVNGERADCFYDTYKFKPDDKVGTYTVTAKLGDIEASEQIRVFTKEIETISAISVGELFQVDDYTSVKITLDWSGVDGDPEPFIDWYVNGELYVSGTDELSFTPNAAGIYDITVKVNGESVQIGGEDKLTVTAKGSIIPTNTAATFNNIYPNVKLSWSYPHNGNMNYRVRIKNLQTGETDETLSSDNLSTSSLFDGTTVNIGSRLDLTRASYEISVCSLGDGNLYTESEYGTAVTLKKLDSNAVSALGSKVLGDALDHYVVSDDEFNEIYAYYMAFRETAKTVNFSVYFGYSSGLAPRLLLSNAFDYGASTGSYRITSYVNGSEINSLFGPSRVRAGDIVRVSIECSSSLSPTKTGGSDYEQFNVLTPHIAENSERTSSHVFEIEKSENKVYVSTSEELYRAAEYGVRPVPRTGTVAETLYGFARSLLTEIISDDMTDVEKVHAIYDWIMWNVRYDYKAIESSNAVTNAAFKAYWLEGVLTGSRDEAFAVCDGMAKTMSLLCRMEGIPAYRVTGIAGSSVAGLSYSEAQSIKNSEWGGHAWNKVYVDGGWYVVDPTWGDAVYSINNRPYEMALHDWLLLSDADIADTHEYDHTTHNPTTPVESYNVYDNTKLEYTTRSGKTETVDMYLNGSGSFMDAEIESVMDYLDWLKRNSTSEIRVGGRVQTRLAVGIELKAKNMNMLLAKAEASVFQNPFKLKLTELGYGSRDYKIYSLSDKVLVTLSL